MEGAEGSVAANTKSIGGNNEAVQKVRESGGASRDPTEQRYDDAECHDGTGCDIHRYTFERVPIDGEIVSRRNRFTDATL